MRTSDFTHRRQQEEYHNLISEFRLSYPESQFNCLRRSKMWFDLVLRMLCVIVIVHGLTLLCFSLCDLKLGENFTF